MDKAVFWQNHSQADINERQRTVLNLFLDGKKGKLTAKRWARLAKVSPDTAVRDVQHLAEIGVLIPEDGKVRFPEQGLDHLRGEVLLRLSFSNRSALALEVLTSLGQELPGEMTQVSGVNGQGCFGKFPEELEQVQFHIHSQICFGILPLLIPFPMGISFGFGPPERVVGNLTAPEWP